MLPFLGFAAMAALVLMPFAVELRRSRSGVYGHVDKK